MKFSWTIAVSVFLSAVQFFANAQNAVNVASRAEKSYSALNVPEIDGRKFDEYGNPALGANVLLKSIGGISCKKSTVVYPGAKSKFSCEVADSLDAEAIYIALNVDEVDGRQVDQYGNRSVGANILVKAAGGITCKKVTVVYPGAQSKFSCTTAF